MVVPRRVARFSISRAALVPAYAVASRTRQTPTAIRVRSPRSDAKRQRSGGRLWLLRIRGWQRERGPRASVEHPASTWRACASAHGATRHRRPGSVLGARTPRRARPAAASMQQRRRADRGARWDRGSGRAGRGEPSDLPLEWAHVAAAPRESNRHFRSYSLRAQRSIYRSPTPDAHSGGGFPRLVDRDSRAVEH